MVSGANPLRGAKDACGKWKNNLGKPNVTVCGNALWCAEEKRRESSILHPRNAIMVGKHLIIVRGGKLAIEVNSIVYVSMSGALDRGGGGKL